MSNLSLLLCLWLAIHWPLACNPLTFGLQSDYKVNTIIWDTQRNRVKKQRIMNGKVKIFGKSLV